MPNKYFLFVVVTTNSPAGLKPHYTRVYLYMYIITLLFCVVKTFLKKFC